MISAARFPYLSILAAAARARSRLGGSCASDSMQLLALVMAAATGCLISCASDACHFPQRTYTIDVCHLDRARCVRWVEKNRLTTGPLQFNYPLPSKDGKKLFVVGIQLRAELIRYDSKSGDFVPYLGGISAGDVAFSRDGQWVTYVSYPENTLWRSKPDGSARLQLSYPPMRTALAQP